jgi:two-component system, NarL family, nitrate/nitrite response regulator NarL
LQSAPTRQASREQTLVAVVGDPRLLTDAIAFMVARRDDLQVVGTAGDSAEAIGLIDRFRPHVLVMSCRSPSDDSIDWALELKARHPSLRVLMIADQPGDDFITRSIVAGLDGLVSMTVSSAGLVDAVLRVANGQTAFDSSDIHRAVRHLVAGSVPTDLTRRELQVLELIAGGVSNADVARRLFISVNTVRTHVRHVLKKLGAHSKLEAVSIALQLGVINIQR